MQKSIDGIQRNVCLYVKKAAGNRAAENEPITPSPRDHSVCFSLYIYVGFGYYRNDKE